MLGGVRIVLHPKLYRAMQGVCGGVPQHPKLYRAVQGEVCGTEPFRGVTLYPRSCRVFLSGGGCVAPQDTARAVRGDLGVAVAAVVQGST